MSAIRFLTLPLLALALACVPASPAAAQQPAATAVVAASEREVDITGDSYLAPNRKPTDDEVAAAIVKILAAAGFNEASKPQPDDDFGKMLARGIARQARDELIVSAVSDLFPGMRASDSAAVRVLICQALDKRLVPNRDRILAELRRNNPDLADATEITEFLIRLSNAANR